MHDQPKRLELSATQVAASALAAVSAAFASSYLGVAGTLIGAAAGSIIATVATAIYVHSMTRTNDRLRAVVLPVATRGSAKQSADQTQVDLSAPTAPLRDGPPREAETTAVLDQPPAQPEPAQRGPARWRAVAAAAAVVFAIAVGTITAIELAAGESLPAMVGNDSSAGTSVGGVVQSDSGGSAPRSPEPFQAPTGTPSEEASPTESTEPAPTPSGSTSPTTDPAPATTPPAPSATTTPSAATPTP